MRNSLLAGADDSSLCMGALSENLGNFIQDGSCLPAHSGDPMLGGLTVSAAGGAFMPILEGSPAWTAAMITSARNIRAIN